MNLNLCAQTGQKRWFVPFKYLVVMKLIVLLITIACLQVSARTLAQNISLSEKNVPLTDVFNSIKKQSNYKFFWTGSDLSGFTVSVAVKNANIKDVMDKVLTGLPLTYSITENTIVIQKKETSFLDNLKTKTNLAGPGVNGIVKDETGKIMPGVTVKVKGTEQAATATNNDGIFQITVPNDEAVIVFSYIGYETQELRFKDIIQGAVITMKASETNLHEVVVSKGYYNERQALLTGNVSKISAKAIEQQPVANPLAALEGQVPGLFITQSTGNPGGGFKIQIRGQSSLINGTDPFIVIDGVPYNSKITGYDGPNSQGTLSGSNLAGGSPLNFINPYDIESIEILKDADATSIYGSRAANGAMLITTKKGKAGATRVSFNVNSGLTTPSRDITLMNTQQYLQVRHEAFKNDGITTIPANAYDLRLWDTTRYTNWSKVFLQNRAVYTDANASISGGNTNTQYLVGAGYNRQTTGTPELVPNAGADQKGSVHFNLNTQTPDQKFKLSLTAGYISDLNTVNGQTDLSFYRFTTAPDAPPLYNPDGSLNWMPPVQGARGSWTNPLAGQYGKYKSNTSNLTSSATISYTLMPGLDVKANLGYTNMQLDEVSTLPTTINDPGRNITTGTSYFGETNTHTWIVEPQANYTRKIGKGILSALVGASFNEQNASNQKLAGAGFINDGLLENIQSAGSITPQSYSSQYKYNALRARLNYTYEDKYILNLTANRDGSSRFGPGKQFGNFWSAGGAWIFSEEKFIKNNLSFLSFGKLRGSYGTTGNDQITDYRFLDLYNSIPSYTATSPSSGLRPQNLFNPDLAWEIDKKLEGGIELGFLNDRISFSASIFRNRSGNQLVTSPVSAVTGFKSIPANLPAVVQNTGQEFELRTMNIKTRDFSWSTSANLTIPKNKLLSFPGLAQSVYASKYVVGQPITILKVYHELGVNPQTGIYEFQAANGTVTSTPNSTTDMNAIVNTAPKFYGGFSNTFSYKGFSLDIMFQFVKQTGPNFFNAFNNNLGAQNVNFPISFYNDHWEQPGDVAKYQMSTQKSGAVSTAASNARSSDFAYSDASYIRLKNLALSWQIPGTWKERLHLQSCRIFLNAQNVLTITNYNGIDPETQGLGSPPKKVWVTGIQMTF
ncbi:SusC/RagA family TonB-linked outer membrane protein [Mucilaginibacter pocheonensis]|uniref:TonB-linked SusC/RagA family outer membrane protein n=1 Tax=Mucilaginibacter pocheonensis TaxID=398050 RepID=A0ABU1T7I4_9SPHI|nr:SusC/RagA family TonB-linked outer membrane protein [Mucilaginibacter pocheonensis]MDR6941358.1 TonB-linked SusC/RagA family outer membrane protein [Mucilaginibacter pocheonensis]